MRSAALGLVVSVAICFAVAALGALFTNRSLADWYPYLRKPSWNPPNWLFGPVWTVLYLLMAVSVWWVWRRDGLTWQVGLFAVQLLLNLAWSAVFFGLKRPGWASGEVVLLWLSIVATGLAFSRTSLFAALLLLPYAAWVGFAAVLNWTIWRMNPPA